LISTAAVSRMKIQASKIYIQDYNYPLPPYRIAEFPLAERDESRLLIYKQGVIEEDKFKNVAHHLPSGSSIILNNTRVIEARLLFQKPTGGVIEIFCLEPNEPHPNISLLMLQTSNVQWRCLIGGASKWKPGQLLQKELRIDKCKVMLTARYVEKQTDCFVIDFSWQPENFSFAEVLHAAGAIPLPPYIKRQATESDAERYQTIFARHQGSVAAPTAALHFTERVFKHLTEKNIATNYITLHVGTGTFKPVKTETIAEHSMHSEHFQVSIYVLENLKKAMEIIAVGTTSLRTLESLYWIGIKIKNNSLHFADILKLEQWEAYELATERISYSDSMQFLIDYMKHHQLEELFCETSLLIIPGYTFQSAGILITNFHQPQSTLLLLVAAFIGEDWKKVYDYALKNDFRFLSYGDSSLLFASTLSFSSAKY
jgi:S-adenosylmethionine:tRNA ribosyltransferase-isomerase